MPQLLILGGVVIAALLADWWIGARERREDAPTASDRMRQLNEDLRLGRKS